MGLYVHTATRWPERLRGLLGRAPLGLDEALCICPCDSVHTYGMAYPLDLIFVSESGRVLRRAVEVAPWRMAWSPGAAAVFELRAGCAARHEAAVLQWWQAWR